MAFTWIPYYKELAQKIATYRNKREDLLQIVRGLDDEFVSYLQKEKDKTKIIDIHPFAFYSIFGRLVDINKKTKILSYFKDKFKLTSDIPKDYDGIPSILPNSSYWSMPWGDNNYSKEINENWDLFCYALEDNYDKKTFIQYFDKVKNQKDVKSKITHALYRMNPDKFLSIDGNTRKYLSYLGIPIFDESELSGKNYLDIIDTLNDYMKSNMIKEKNFYEFSYNAWMYGKELKNYWLIAPGENARLWDDFYTNNIIGIGWDDLGDYSAYKNKREKFTNDFLDYYGKEKKRSATQVWRFYKEIQEGDYVIVKNGLYQILAIGIINSDYYFDNSRTEYKSLRDVKWIKTGEWDFPGQAPQETVTLLKDEKVKEIMNIINQADNAQTISLANLLETNKNLILHGAPGTGKTHLAKEIAAQMICGKSFEEIEKGSDEEKAFSEQTEFVQFHPSYDYSDFVEGIRPIEGENGEVSFERKDGIFKAFCEKALKKTSSAEETNFDDCWDSLIDYVRENLASDKLTKIGSWEYGLSSKESLKYSSVNSPSQYNFTITKQNVYDAYQGKKARPKGGFQKEMNQIVDFMKEKFKLIPYDKIAKYEIDNKQYIFIIDEINRGELSKIFGELFFSIEPSYRGKKGKVRTQYANMLKESNSFDDELNTSTFGNFFIPDNVYIIGTMNDIDRSVESMDFAMRRRFIFEEVTAEDSAENMNLSQDAKDRMTRINTAIHDTEGLNDAYKIGGAYFLNVDDFDKLWKIKLSSLIKEYLRGIDDDGSKYQKIEDAYFNRQVNDYSDNDE